MIMTELYKIDDLTLKQVASICDHTFLMPDQAYHEKAKEIKITAAALREKEFYSFLEFTVKTDLIPYAVCVLPQDVAYARLYLDSHGGSEIKVASVIGYPNGDWASTEEKIECMKKVSREGAAEIDPVIRYGALKSGNEDVVVDEMRKIVDLAHGMGMISKYILENCELTPYLIRRACKIANSCNADFVKTNTGMGYSLAKEKDIIIMKEIFSRGIKIAGGVVEANYRSLLRAASGRTDGMIELDPMKIRIGESKLIAEKKSGY
jgi:deoxyribose-phosphate aldolase